MRDECRYYNTCNVPLCPLDPSRDNYIWYPDEEICKRTEFGKLLWVKNQKKIAKRTKRKDLYYTYEMLNRKMIIGKGMTGLDPDKPEKDQLRKWFKNHPVQRELSEEEKEIRRQRMIQVIQMRDQKLFSEPQNL